MINDRLEYSTSLNEIRSSHRVVNTIDVKRSVFTLISNKKKRTLVLVFSIWARSLRWTDFTALLLFVILPMARCNSYETSSCVLTNSTRCLPAWFTPASAVSSTRRELGVPTVLRSDYPFSVSSVDSTPLQLKKNRRDFLSSWISHQCSPKVTCDDGGFTGTEMKRKENRFSLVFAPSIGVCCEIKRRKQVVKKRKKEKVSRTFFFSMSSLLVSLFFFTWKAHHARERKTERERNRH